ncbi:hypothetical protein ZWY2020_059996 [Hordeum vulgare]|nr:hypothetical protein ZWY2020_059996 [Hordeum vulgare]
MSRSFLNLSFTWYQFRPIYVPAAASSSSGFPVAVHGFWPAGRGSSKGGCCPDQARRRRSHRLCMDRRWFVRQSHGSHLTPQSSSYGVPPSQPCMAPSALPYGAPSTQPYRASPSSVYGVQPSLPHYGVTSLQPYAAHPSPPYGTHPLPYETPPSAPYGGFSATTYGASLSHPLAPTSMGYGAHPSMLETEASLLVHAGAMPPGAAASSMPSPLGGHATTATSFYFTHLLLVKLMPNNYLAWRAHVLPLLRSHYLEGYANGALPCPPSDHPSYHAWVAQDQAILSAIQSSLTEGVSLFVLFATNS